MSLPLALFRFGPFVSFILNGCYNLWHIGNADMELGQVSLFSDLWEGKIHTISEQEHYFCLGKQMMLCKVWHRTWLKCDVFLKMIKAIK